jgi:hypothetical protein
MDIRPLASSEDLTFLLRPHLALPQTQNARVDLRAAQIFHIRRVYQGCIRIENWWERKGRKLVAECSQRSKEEMKDEFVGLAN